MHKFSKIIMRCFLLAAVACVLTIDAKTVGMESCPMLDEEKASIVENIHLQIIQDDSQNTGIQCFDVSLDGLIALGSTSGGNKMIYIYDENGVFQYGFCFYCDGAYGITFQGENLGIYFLRGNVLVTYDSRGSCVGVQKMAETKEHYEIINDLLNRTEKIVAGKHYSMERDMELGDSYSRFVVTNELGVKTVLYDATTNHSLVQIIFMVFLVGVFGIIVYGCVQKISGGKRST